MSNVLPLRRRSDFVPMSAVIPDLHRRIQLAERHIEMCEREFDNAKWRGDRKMVDRWSDAAAASDEQLANLSAELKQEVERATGMRAADLWRLLA